MQPARPLRFRFTDEQDIAAYGDGWWLWDETEVSRLRGREMIDLEEATDVPLLAVFRLLRKESALANMAAMWIALHRGGHPVKWADFNPIIPLVEWDEVPATAPLDSGEAPAPDSDSSPAPSMESVSS